MAEHEDLDRKLDSALWTLDEHGRRLDGHDRRFEGVEQDLRLQTRQINTNAEDIKDLTEQVQAVTAMVEDMPSLTAAETAKQVNALIDRRAVWYGWRALAVAGGLIAASIITAVVQHVAGGVLGGG